MKKVLFVILFFLCIKVVSQDSISYTPPDSVEIERQYKGISFVVPIHYERTDDITYVTVKQVQFEITEEDLREHNGKTYFIVDKKKFWRQFKRL